MTTQQAQVTSTADRDHAIAVLTTAFSNDPIGRWAFPDAQQYLAAFPPIPRTFAAAAFECGTAHCADAFSGIALWLPPGVDPAEEAMGQLLESSIPDDRKPEVFKFFGQMGPFHPKEALWYLAFIGVDPSQQGRGYGSALLSHALASCDEQGSLAYLEASSLRSKALYTRHGFEEIGVIQAGSSPPMWPMLRKPR